MASNEKPIILYDNRFEDGTPTATDTETGYDVANITDLRTYTFWKAASSGTKYITVNCASAKSADALGIVGHNLYTASATISVESSPDNSEWTERLAGFVPPSDRALLKRFTSVSAQYWRVKIVTASVQAKIAVIILGVRVTMEKYPLAPFDPMPQSIVAQQGISDEGNLLGVTIEFIDIQIQAQFSNLTPSWVTNTFVPAWDVHLSLCKPFFWAWDVENHATEVYFVQILARSALSMPYEANRRSLALAMRGMKE